MSYKIPLFDLNYGADEIAAFKQCVDDNWISIGPKCEAFETEFGRLIKAPYALTVDNCTNALFLAMLALDIHAGDEVLVPSLTFAATVNCVRYVGATPVFCDITSNENLCIDPREMEHKITPQTKAVIVMHYGGFPCDMDAILAIADKHNLKVIEDACHGPLSEYHSPNSVHSGMKLGTMGDIGCFSFFSNKNISTGEGGMIVCNQKSLYDRIKLLRSHGMTTSSYQRAGGHSTKYDIETLGYNFRMDDIRASLGLAQLRKLQADLEQRQQVRRWYEEALSDIKQIIVPFLGHRGFVSNYIFPVLLKNGTADDRDRVRDQMHACGIQTSVHYPAAHRFSIYKACAAELPLTEFASDHLITLPMYSKLTREDVAFVGTALREAL